MEARIVLKAASVMLAAFVFLVSPSCRTPSQKIPAVVEQQGSNAQRHTPASQEKTSFEEKLLATMPADLQAWAMDSLVDFQEREKFVKFSSDGTHVTYFASKDGRHFCMFGNRKGPEFEQFDWHLTYSTDGKHVAFCATNGGKQFLVIDDRKVEGLGYVTDVALSSDGARVACCVEKDCKRFVILLDAVTGESWKQEDFYQVWSPVFSPNGGKLAYFAANGDNKFVVMDGRKERQRFTKIGHLVFSPDGAQLIFAGKNFGKWFLVNGQKGGEGFDYVEPPVFSPDGRQVAYRAVKGMKRLVVVGEEKGEEFDSVGEPVFSPDSKRVAYRAKKEDKEFIVVNGTKGKEYALVGNPVFSADSQHLAYWAARDWKTFIVLDAVEGKSYHDSIAGDPVLSPDGRVVAYCVSYHGRGTLMVSDRDVAIPGWFWPPTFSPDSKKVAFGAKKGNELWWKIVDIQ